MVNNYFLNCNFDDLGIVSEGCGSCLRSQSVRGGEGRLGWGGSGREKKELKNLDLGQLDTVATFNTPWRDSQGLSAMFIHLIQPSS